MQKYSQRVMLWSLVFFALCALRAVADDVKIWPLFYRDTDVETQTTRTELMWPLYVRERTPDYAANQFLSFPQTFPTDYPHQFYFLWPLSGVRTGAGHDAWLFPFLWSGAAQGGNDHHLAIFPAFYYGEDDDETTLNLALLLHNRWDKHGSRHYLLPLFWSTRNTTDTYSRRSFGLLPLVWLNGYRNNHASYSARSRSGGALLLSWWARGSSTNTTGQGVHVSENSAEGLFPVFHRTSTSSTISSRTDARRTRNESLWVMPYWQSYKASGDVEKSRHRLFPLYWDWSETKGRTADTGRTLLPLWWRSSTREAGTLTESADFLVPFGAHFYRKGEYDTQNVLGPIFNRTENTRTATVRYDAFFPFFSLTRGEAESGGHVFPLAGRNVARGRHDNLWYLFPLGWDCESQETFDYRMARPQMFALHEMESRPAVLEADCRNGPRRTVAFYPFFWSKRQADVQNQGVLPLYWQTSRRCGRSLSVDTTLPLLLGGHDTNYRDELPVYSRQSYLLSLIAHGRGDNMKEWRVLPFFSYDRSGGSLDYSSFVLPFSYESWRDPERPGQAYSSKLSVPFSCLPLFRTAASQDAASGSEKSWLFPLYKREKNSGSDGDRSKLSILWPLWNGEWMNGETRIRGLGGVVNYYERDANGFVEQRLLYRVFSRRTRSWYTEHELMPLYAQSRREDGASSWGFLGGLIGGGCDGSRNYLRLLYLKIGTGAVQPAGAETLAARQKQHAELALKYLQHDRHDRAAIEFTLSGSAFSDDAGFQLAAGEAYLKARADALGKELRSSVPSSLDPIYGKAGGGRACSIEQNLRTLAVHRFEEALRLGADKPTTLCRLAAALRELGKRPEALQRLEESDRLLPSFATAMLRLETATAIWAERLRRTSPDGESEAAAAAVLSLLSELQERYPHSPTLALEEGAFLMRARDPQRYASFAGYADAMFYASGDFSPSVLKQLELYQQGATWTPGTEEQAWLNSRPAQEAGRALFASGRPGRAAATPPATRCARLAATILNRQMSALLGDKKYDEAGALRLPIFRLLPRTCARCDVPDTRSDRVDYEDPTATCLQNLYALCITVSNRPLDYIAHVEGLAPALCRHRQPVLADALESVRLEQQYIKTWHIAGEVGGKPVSRSYAGQFFERYVDLDALLGQPDRCTVTAQCLATSPDERKVVLRLGFDHALTAELNGRVVFGPKHRKIAVRDEYRVPLVLKAGENRLKLTVADDTLAYGFFARLSSESGEYMKDVTVTGAAGDR
jgi:hypothetical protein